MNQNDVFDMHGHGHSIAYVDMCLNKRSFFGKVVPNNMKCYWGLLKILSPYLFSRFINFLLKYKKDLIFVLT